jgi:transcriptional regulator with XRE-family HTH domain
MFDQLGPILRRLRNERRRSQAEVARVAEIQRTTLSRYETGELVPSLGNLGKILTALEVPLTRLAEELTPATDPPPRAPERPNAEPATAGAEEEAVAPETLVVADLLLGGARDLSPEAREVFTDLLDDVYHLSRLLQRPGGGREGGDGH